MNLIYLSLSEHYCILQMPHLLSLEYPLRKRHTIHVYVHVHVHVLYLQCTVHVPTMYCICTCTCTCTYNVLYMYIQCTVHVHTMYCTCTYNVLYMYIQCTVYVHVHVHVHAMCCICTYRNTLLRKRDLVTDSVTKFLFCVCGSTNTELLVVPESICSFSIHTLCTN